MAKAKAPKAKGPAAPSKAARKAAPKRGGGKPSLPAKVGASAASRLAGKAKAAKAQLAKLPKPKLPKFPKPRLPKAKRAAAPPPTPAEPEFSFSFEADAERRREERRRLKGERREARRKRREERRQARAERREERRKAKEERREARRKEREEAQARWAAERAARMERERLQDARDAEPEETIVEEAEAEGAMPVPGPAEREPAPIVHPEPAPEEDESEEPESQPEEDEEEEEEEPEAMDDEPDAEADPFLVRMEDADDELDGGNGAGSRDATSSRSAGQAVVQVGPRVHAHAGHAQTDEEQEADAEPTVRAESRATPLGQELPSPREGAGLSLPEQFVLLAYRDGWDDRMMKPRAGSQGAAIAGSLVLELALRGAVRLQRGRILVEDGIQLPPSLSGVAARLRQLQQQPSQSALEGLCKGLPDRLHPILHNLQQRGVLRIEQTKAMGFLPRQHLVLLEGEVKDKLENRVVRTLAGGGNPDARTIMLLGLVEASGLLRDLVPEMAYDFNRKRIHGLLTGRDALSYRVDSSLRRVQDVLLQTVLHDVRAIQGT